MTSPVPHLLEVEALLRKYDNPAQADRVRDGRIKFEREGASAYRDFATGYWWGGSGSIADVELHRFGRLDVTKEEKEDNRKLCLALISIYDSMRASGVISEGADKWTGIWRSDLKKGI